MQYGNGKFQGFPGCNPVNYGLIHSTWYLLGHQLGHDAAASKLRITRFWTHRSPKDSHMKNGDQSSKGSRDITPLTMDSYTQHGTFWATNWGMTQCCLLTLTSALYLENCFSQQTQIKCSWQSTVFS